MFTDKGDRYLSELMREQMYTLITVVLIACRVDAPSFLSLLAHYVWCGRKVHCMWVEEIITRRGETLK